MRKTQLLAAVCLFAFVKIANAQAVLTFAGNAQHTSIYQPVAQDLNRIRWTTSVNLNNTGAFAHYAAPLVTAANTVIVPVKTALGFQMNTFTGSAGAAMYSLTSDYILPSSSWIPVYQPVVATGAFGTRLYYPGAGGTVYFIDNPDSMNHTVPAQRVFYTSLVNYQSNASAFNSTVFINTPITADSTGNIFFGFRVQGTAPAPLNTTQSGFARIDPSGNAVYVLAGTAAADANIGRDTHNSAPALSNDESTVYVPVKHATTDSYGYLLGLDATNLSTKYKVFLKDPRNGHVNNASILDVSTASPTVAPDGDVYFGIFANPSNGSRGFLLRFSGDLSVEKTPGGFGWDYTPAIVPSSMVPSYSGPSTYLIFAKYNNYPFADGDGVNRIALLDPNVTQIDPHPSANGLVVMREVRTVIGPTPDPDYPSIPDAVREWCINTAAVNPATNSIFTPSEDGHLYRWNVATNSLAQVTELSAGIGQPYVPSIIGPDGTVYTLNGGTLFAVGGLSGVRVSVVSSAPDLRNVVANAAVTFTATVANTTGSGFTTTGTVTFEDSVYSLSGETTTTLAVISLNPAGQATYTTSGLGAGQHFINAIYSGDSIFGGGSMTLVQNMHAFGSTTSLTSTPNPSSPGQAVTFTATVASIPPGSVVPMGMVIFREGSNVLAQIALSSGTASFNSSSLSAGSHNITAVYASDSHTAASSGSATQVVQSSGGSTTTTVGSSPNPSVFGQVVTFTATVSSVTGTPTGAVTFQEGATILASGVLVDGTGHASFNTGILAVGSHVVTANFTGSNGWGNSTGSNAGAPQIVNRAGTTTQVSSSSSVSVFGQMVTFTATVTANPPGAGIPGSSVTLKDGATSLETKNLDATGHATFTVSGLAVGVHSITVVYSGNTNFNGSTSNALTQTVNKAATTTAITSSANPSAKGAAVTFTATVSASAPGAGIPAGTVTFRDKGAVFGTATLDATGRAAFTTSTLAQGTDQITASYNGGSNHLASTSSTLAQRVNKK